MSLIDRINADLKQAMRDRATTRLEAIRALRGEVIKLSKSGADEAPDDEAVLQQVKSLIKQRQESIAMFEKGGREELAVKERDQIEVLQEYLPPQLSEEELQTMVTETVSETGAEGMRDMGRVMGALQSKISASGKDADNRRVAALVKAALSS